MTSGSCHIYLHVWNARKRETLSILPRRPDKTCFSTAISHPSTSTRAAHRVLFSMRRRQTVIWSSAGLAILQKPRVSTFHSQIESFWRVFRVWPDLLGVELEPFFPTVKAAKARGFAARSARDLLGWFIGLAPCSRLIADPL